MNNVLAIILCIVCFTVGFISGLWGYEDLMFEDVHDGYVGFYLANSAASAVTIVTQYPNYQGDWICVDAEEMYDYDYIVETCSHEVAHKIYADNVWNYSWDEDEAFALYCEDDISKCIGVDWEAFDEG